MDEDLSSDSGEESDSVSSCSSMADSEYSIAESSGKGSSTATTSDLPSGNTSENENPSLCGESPACNSEANLVSTKTFELHEQQKIPAQKVSTNHEESVNPETNKQDRLLSKETSFADNEPPMSKEITKQDTASSQSIASENTAKSEDNGCDAEGETTERKCKNSAKGKDEPSSGQCGRAQNTPSSGWVSLNF